jgi:stalled ribosome rescue protein Dom34
MKKTGIWIDKKKAVVITIDKNEEEVHEVYSEIDDFHVKGGSGTRFKGGPQDVVHDSKYLAHEKKQLKEYFKELVPFVERSDKVVIFGPAQAGKKLAKEISERYTSLTRKIRGVEKADNMTPNQLKAWVRDYFG